MNSVIVLYGASKRSFDAVTAAEKLTQNGYTDIYISKGGIEDWLSEGFSLEGEAVNETYDPQTVLTLEDGSYKIDTDQSIIEWSGRNPTTTHFGDTACWLRFQEKFVYYGTPKALPIKA